MLGNILYGSYVYSDSIFGVLATEEAVSLSNSTSGVLLRVRATFTSLPGPRDPANDVTIDLRNSDGTLRPGRGIAIGSYGAFAAFGTTFVSGVSIGSYADFKSGELTDTGISRIGLEATAIFDIEHPDDNSIAWSNIGALDFTVGSDNVAGNMPMDWAGIVYAIHQLGQSNKIYVYGESGITLVSPSGLYYARKELSNLGIKNKQAVINTKSGQYFISVNGNLYKISLDNTIHKLGYKEFFDTMGTIVMSYDSLNRRVYFCDGTDGYVYSEDTQGFTKGPANITGIHYQGTTQYIASDGDISNPDFLLVTGPYNMGTGKEKTISDLLLKVSDTTGIEVAIDYRVKMKDSFTTLPYKSIGEYGDIRYSCYGREFRFRVKGTDVASDFKLESITITGIIHGFSFLDTITMK